MSRIGLFVAVTLALAVCADARKRHSASAWTPNRSAADDRITSLPGLSSMPPFAMYSGYVPIAGTPQNLFYWFVESAVNPETDPLVLWMNGGPGCSSMLGLLTEHGPVRVSDDGSSLSLNPYSWNLAGANIIYLESPSGVGFSYGTNNNYTTGDNDTATHNLEFLFGWFNKFPQYMDNPFFVAGESYAGNYVPELSNLIVDSNAAGVNPTINFGGFLVGNPTFDFNMIGNGYVPVMHYHAFLSTEQYQSALTACNGTFAPPPNSQCSALLASFTSQYYGINPYNIEGACVGAGPDPAGGCFTSAFLSHIQTGAVPKRGFGQTFIPCIDITGIRTYLNQASVQSALHVSPLFVSPWDACSDVLHYNQYADKLQWIYHKIINAGYRIMVYSGDCDSCVPYLGTEYCINSLQLPISTAWESWTIIDEAGYTQIAGKGQSYANGSLTYLTVRGAGHMVPHDSPIAAQALFAKFITGK